MSKKDTLYYSKNEYKRISETLKRLKNRFKCDFVIVGGIANRYLFSEWAEDLSGDVLNDIDVMLLPEAGTTNEKWFDVSLKKDFYVTHINSQYDGYYLALIDRQTYLAIDIFTRPRNISVQEIYIEDEKYLVCTNEEIFISVMRNIYEMLVRDIIFDPKHFIFKKHLEGIVDKSEVLKLWAEEKKIVRFKKEEYSFETFDEYEKVIEKLQDDKKGLIYKKIIPSGKKKYVPNDIEVNGVTIEDEKHFQEAYRLKREVQNL